MKFISGKENKILNRFEWFLEDYDYDLHDYFLQDDESGKVILWTVGIDVTEMYSYDIDQLQECYENKVYPMTIYAIDIFNKGYALEIDNESLQREVDSFWLDHATIEKSVMTLTEDICEERKSIEDLFNFARERGVVYNEDI